MTGLGSTELDELPAGSGEAELLLRRQQRSARLKGGTLGGLRGLGLAAIIAASVAPFLYVLSVSFKHSYSLFTYPPHWIPHPLTFTNYRDVLDAYPFVRWMVNTVGVASVVTALKVVIDSMAAYALARINFVGRGVVSALMISALLVPQAMLIIPLYFIVKDLGIFNTYWALILPPLANPLGVFMLRAFIRGLPIDLEHAARVDGCNEFQIYRRIVLPLIRPGLVVVAIYTFVLQYSSFVWPLVGTDTARLQLISVGLSTLNPLGGAVELPYGYLAAASVMATIVMAGVFLAFQRQFVGASLLGALKE
jgi:ABC-type glycerol-3-phosphate transport system permease component